MPYMTDTAFTAALINYMFSGATNSLSAITGPLKLRLMTAMGAGNGNIHNSNGTEATSSNCPGYTAGGSTMGSTAFSTFSSTSPAAITNNNAVSWSATGSWTSVVGAEIWNSGFGGGAATRQAQGLLTSTLSGVSNGDTVEFAASGGVTLDPSAE